MIHSFIEECSILISRFSTVIYEAMHMGRQAIYFNPHGETMRLFNEDATGGIHKSNNSEDLIRVLRNALEGDSREQQERMNAFLTLHCGSTDGNAALRV